MSDRVDLSISSRQVDETGARDFFWPLDPLASVPVREHFLNSAVPLIRRSCLSDDPTALATKIFFKWLAAEVFGFYETTKLITLFGQAGVRPVVPRHYRRLAALMVGRRPPVTFYEKLAKGPPSGLRAPRFVKAFLRETYWNRGLTPIVSALRRPNDITTISPNALSLQHARMGNEYQRYSHITDWFSGCFGKWNGNTGISGSRSSFVNDLLDTISESFAAGGECLPDQVFEYFISWLSDASAFYVLCRANLFDRRSTIPNELWSGCLGSNPFTALLSNEVRRHGGRTVGHDHGYGSAFYESASLCFSDYNHCDQFFTFNKTQARLKRTYLRRDMMWEGKATRIASLDDITDRDAYRSKNPREISFKRPIRNLLYVGTAYHGEGVRFRPIMPDIVRLDWVARLIAFVKACGINVIHKPHPEGQSQPPPNLAESLGCRTVHRSFERVREPVDAYLTDFIYSSTKGPILKSELPVILIDLGYPRIIPEAMKTLRRRCEVIPAWFDGTNRVQTDWDRLASVLTRNVYQFDMEFPDTHFANT